MKDVTYANIQMIQDNQEFFHNRGLELDEVPESIRQGCQFEMWSERNELGSFHLI